MSIRLCLIGLIVMIAVFTVKPYLFRTCIWPVMAPPARAAVREALNQYQNIRSASFQGGDRGPGVFSSRCWFAERARNLTGGAAWRSTDGN